MKPKTLALIGLLAVSTLSACRSDKHIAVTQEPALGSHVYRVGSKYFGFDDSFFQYYGTNDIPAVLNVAERIDR